MSVTTENAPVQGQTTLQENRAGEGVYASLFEKINLAPASRLGDINDFLDDAALSEAPAAERLTAAMQVFLRVCRRRTMVCLSPPSPATWPCIFLMVIGEGSMSSWAPSGTERILCRILYRRRATPLF